MRMTGWGMISSGALVLLLVAPLATRAVGSEKSLRRSAMSLQQYLALPHSAPDRRLHYGLGPLQFGELRMPEGHGPFPIAVLIHGGCWEFNFDLQPLDAMAEALRKAGMATWNIEFRRIGDAGGGWPGTYLDVARATDYVRQLATRYPLDLSRVIAIGHSSGAQLASWLSGRHELRADSPLYTKNPLSLRAVVLLAGVPDMAAAVGGKLRQGDATCLKANTEVMGGTPAQVPAHYAQASPIQMVPLGTPQDNVVGSKDNPQRLEQLRRFVAVAQAAGDRASLTVVPGAGHFDMVNPAGPAWPAIEAVILRAAALRR